MDSINWVIQLFESEKLYILILKKKKAKKREIKNSMC